MGCCRSCAKSAGYERLDPADAEGSAFNQMITDLGVPAESEVLAAIEAADDENMTLSDVELAIYISDLNNK
jgi:hypothetical protein